MGRDFWDSEQPFAYDHETQSDSTSTQPTSQSLNISISQLDHIPTTLTLNKKVIGGRSKENRHRLTL